MSYLVVLAAAILYAVAAMFIKRASDLGVGPVRILLLANVFSAVLFQGLWWFGGEVHPHLWWQPAAVAACFMAGQGLTFWSLHQGDVSVATPVLGVKILIVAVLVTLLAGESLSIWLWLAAALATLGVAMLNRRPVGHHHHIGFTIITSMGAAAAFALFDVLVQKWSPGWGLGSFLPLAIAMAGAVSLGLFPLLKSKLAPVRRQAWPWLAAAVAGIALQALLITSSIAHWQHAAEANVIYSSRGLWSVLLVWLAGHWFHTQEKKVGASILTSRLAGATLMTLAIVLVVF